ncbi:DUF4942 domain-containing protein [Rahnella selenatireducens]|uniref:DUF4942 domain-containing protein n=1 Tax=Rahnella selenatireducens TaxID=3389797 RepID=UPI00396866D2
MLNEQHTAVADLDINGQHAGEMIPSVAIDRIIALRENGLKQFTDALELLGSARRLFLDACNAKYLHGYDICVKEAINWEKQPQRAQNAIRKTIDGKIWDRLMNETGMYTLMSTRQRDEWDRQLSGENMPEITLDTVLATFNQLHASKNDTFEQGVIDLFKSLSWDYKTNNPCRFGKKIIVSLLMDSYSSGRIHFSTLGRSKLDDLTKVFYLLEGRNVPDYRVSEGAKFAEYFARERFSGEVYESEYFSMRYYLKGTAHITFKRPELVDRINDIVARHYPSMLPSRL